MLEIVKGYAESVNTWVVIQSNINNQKNSLTGKPVGSQRLPTFKSCPLCTIVIPMRQLKIYQNKIATNFKSLTSELSLSIKILLFHDYFPVKLHKILYKKKKCSSR